MDDDLREEEAAGKKTKPKTKSMSEDKEQSKSTIRLHEAAKKVKKDCCSLA